MSDNTPNNFKKGSKSKKPKQPSLKDAMIARLTELLANRDVEIVNEQVKVRKLEKYIEIQQKEIQFLKDYIEISERHMRNERKEKMAMELSESEDEAAGLMWNLGLFLMLKIFFLFVLNFDFCWRILNFYG